MQGIVQWRAVPISRTEKNKTRLSQLQGHCCKWLLLGEDSMPTLFANEYCYICLLKILLNQTGVFFPVILLSTVASRQRELYGKSSSFPSLSLQPKPESHCGSPLTCNSMLYLERKCYFFLWGSSNKSGKGALRLNFSQPAVTSLSSL